MSRTHPFTPCEQCEVGEHTRCIHQWASTWCTCTDPACQRRRYNNAVRKVVDMAERIGLMVSQDLDHSDEFPPLYDDMRVALIVPTGRHVLPVDDPANDYN